MYAIAFDMTVTALEGRHPKGSRAGYADIERIMKKAGFHRVQGSVFLNSDPDLSSVTHAMLRLRDMDWFAQSVRDIRAFKVEDWSDFTYLFKEPLS